MKILLIEDSQELSTLLVAELRRHGFLADAADNAADATDALSAGCYAGIVLDLGLPDQDGLDWLRQTRSSDVSTPVLVLTARAGVNDCITGLQAGADDYLVKPFEVQELMARLRALLRRSTKLLGQRLALGNVTFDTETRQVLIDGIARPFPGREAVVLELLLRRSGHVVLRRLIEDQLFGLGEVGGPNAVQVYVHRLRHMLVKNGARVEIHTVRGLGYLLSEK
jgi:two-component system response regulator TctD